MGRIAIIGAEVFTPRVRLASGLVLVEDGRIRAVGRSHEIPLPPDTRLLDAGGLQVLPALVDLAWRGEMPPPLETGIGRFAPAVTVREETDLDRVAAAAMSLRASAAAGRSPGLHLILLDEFPSWDAIQAAADDAIALVTLPAAHPHTPVLARRLWRAGPRLILAGPTPTDPFLADGITCGLAATTDPAAPLSARSWLVTPTPAAAAPARALLLSRREEPLTAALLAAPEPDPVVLLAATSHPAAFLGLPAGRLAPGTDADLLCRSRQGEVVWRMVKGALEAAGGS
ncbi:MAG: hypothetical protein N2383_00705 [Caldilineales bacterium]|nr:hypothetical protein [Caldilineales bacterium]